jgi:hypothetical protein
MVRKRGTVDTAAKDWGHPRGSGQRQVPVVESYRWHGESYGDSAREPRSYPHRICPRRIRIDGIPAQRAGLPGPWLLDHYGDRER